MAIDPPKLKDRVQSPRVLYVESVEFDPPLLEKGRRITVEDLEMSEEIAMQFVKEIVKRVNLNASAPIRVRFVGTEVKP